MSILQDGTAVTTLTQAIGTTTLLKLSRVTVGAVADVYAKLESRNPGGSVKDRIAYAMIKDGED